MVLGTCITCRAGDMWAWPVVTTRTSPARGARAQTLVTTRVSTTILCRETLICYSTCILVNHKYISTLNTTFVTSIAFS